MCAFVCSFEYLKVCLLVCLNVCLNMCVCICMRVSQNFIRACFIHVFVFVCCVFFYYFLVCFSILRFSLCSHLFLVSILLSLSSFLIAQNVRRNRNKRKKKYVSSVCKNYFIFVLPCVCVFACVFCVCMYTYKCKSNMCS